MPLPKKKQPSRLQVLAVLESAKTVLVAWGPVPKNWNILNSDRLLQSYSIIVAACQECGHLEDKDMEWFEAFLVQMTEVLSSWQPILWDME